ncbi:MAG: Na/Pi cotransporter family protein, partial [Clostridium sp.]
VKLVNKVLPGVDEVEKDGAIYLDKGSLHTPIVACNQVYKETIRMANKSKNNLILAMKGFLENDESSITKVYANEKIINTLEKEITNYLVEVSQLELPEDEIRNFASTYHVINDVERIGDHAENIADLAIEKINGKIDMGSDAIEELTNMYNKTLLSLEYAINVYEKKESRNKDNIEMYEAEVDKLEKELRASNIMRLNNKVCSASSSVVFLDMISNLERIGDHANNIGKL